MKKYAKRIASLLATAVFASSLLCSTAFAEDKETGFKKPEDDSILVAYPDGKKEPTLSFDTKDFMNYVTITEDGTNEAGITVERQTKVRYQGGCMVVRADNKTERAGNPADPNDLNNTDPDYEIPGENGLPYVYNYQMGIQLDAEKFGLENFDGCTISMMVKFHPDAAVALNNSSMSLHASDTEGVRTGERSVEFSEIEAKGFRNGILIILEPSSILDTEDSSKAEDEKVVRGDTASFTITFPFIAAYKGDVAYIDNLTIQTPLTDADGNKLYVKNVDGYNASASIDNTDTAIQVGENITVDSVVLESVPDEAGEGGKGVIVVIVIVAVVLVIGIGVFIFIKMKNRFY